MTLGDKLSRLRKENNYTQEQLADILGVSRQAISKWESDVAYPETDKLIRLSTLYHCSLDYLVKEDVDEPQFTMPQQRSSSDMTVKANKLFRGILRFAPLVLYALWALSLWALYAVKFVDDKNLYEWFGRSAIRTLQPTINALISLGVISCAYIAVLGVLQRFGGKKANLLANIGSFLFQAGVIVCVMCVIGVCKKMGIEQDNVVVVVASVTGAFVLLQALFIALDCYFNHDEKVDLKPKNTVSAIRKTWAFICLHKVIAIIVACVLIAGIVLSIVLPLTIGDIFSAKRVSRIQIGDSRDDVKRVLGEPINVDLSELAEIVGDDELRQVSNDVYYYCSPKAERLIKDICGRIYDSFNSMDDIEVVMQQLYKLMQDLAKLEFEYIEVYFEDDGVVEVEYNAKYCMSRENEIKWNVSGKKKQQLNILPSEIPYGETPFSAELYAQAFYTDGSYRLSRIENVSAVGNAQDGWTMTWSDDWGSYQYVIYQNTDTSNVVEHGQATSDISYTVTDINMDGEEGYLLKILGEGALSNGVEYGWTKYSDGVLEVIVSDGITNVPDNAFKNFINLTKLTLPDTISKIGSSAFYGCKNITFVNLSNVLSEIGMYAFYNCANIPEINLTENLITIGAHAFEGCADIDSITIPSSVMTIGNASFANCTSLRYLEWNVTSNCSVGSNVFQNTPSLTTVVLGRQAEIITQGLFRNCSGLREVDAYRSQIKSVGARAFENCFNLVSIEFRRTDYNNDYVEVGEYAFANCTSLLNIKMYTTVYSKGVFYGCTSLQDVGQASFDGVKVVQDYAFYGCVSLQYVGFGGSGVYNYVEYVGEKAFYNCSSMENIFLNTLTYSLEIRPYAFYGCTSLTFVSSYIHWIVKSNDSDEGKHIVITENEEMARLMTGTYCSYIWLKKSP